ncbi:hypothetical protein [Agrobacterium tumefaciens]|uniref:hypothetical protein n=1 Tax=Agrobacterium tumefaciens TaxID=358 RepID=UPI0010472EA3|nr:hypothetical protein [Agrobacterium tumefaciens]TCV55149.1 hypothetical protein EDB97_101241 [Agrobacterium tumefaciens]
MSNFHSIQLEQAATPEQRASWQRALEAEQRINGTAFTPASPTATIGGKVMEIQAGTTSGNDKFISRGVQSADVSFTSPGRVMIGGVETTIEGAIAAGLMTREEAASGFKQPVQPKAQAGAGTEQATKEAPKATTEEPATEAAQAAAEAGKVLDSLDQAIGSHAVDMALESAAESGEMPEDGLPEGVTSEHVAAVVAGYTAQANDTLSHVGASVSMLEETLTDAELRDARRATVQNNADLMHDLGRQAVERLARMPETNPDAFAEMMEGMSPAERSVLRQKPRGEWTVAIPGYPEMSFAAAVRTGIVRV